eukprot:TRINITY_DN11292_c0_g1_i2.p1 TRINITY_DN11292_c0_g1~~TRINITY_DN11292_c0_g1_i2.p1  ORF type:complete len:254 (+),score=36.39 TRINITY_DN11292_c0_g1_i2:94-855(+)
MCIRDRYQRRVRGRIRESNMAKTNQNQSKRGKSKRRSPSASKQPQQPSRDPGIGDCAVCLEGLAGRGWRRLSCKHLFHDKCLDSWFSKAHTTTCPVCRTVQPPDWESIAPTILKRESPLASKQSCGNKKCEQLVRELSQRLEETEGQLARVQQARGAGRPILQCREARPPQSYAAATTPAATQSHVKDLEALLPVPLAATTAEALDPPRKAVCPAAAEDRTIRVQQRGVLSDAPFGRFQPLPSVWSMANGVIW